MKSISAGWQTVDSPNLGLQTIDSSKFTCRTMHSLVAAAMIASSIMVSSSQAHAASAIASLPMPTVLAQATTGGVLLRRRTLPRTHPIGFY